MANVYVLFWFDVEDYIAPQSDDALLRLLRIFDNAGVKGTWKLVGEQLRTMERRGRLDIIEALARHDLGYHTDWHSVHPTVAEYLEPLGWFEGVAEFERRERAGMDDMERIFGKGTISCYGQPGSSWGPQTYPVLKDWGIPVYLDELQQVGLNDQPFWYCNMLNVLRLRANVTRLNLDEGMAGVPAAGAKIKAIVDRLRQKGGTASIYHHPNEWVTSEFWDGANFAAGQNPPREQWRMPALKSPVQAEEGYRAFETYLHYVRDLPDVSIITAKDLLSIYPDIAYRRSVSQSNLVKIAEQLVKEITYIPLDSDAVISPAEAFTLVVGALAGYHSKGSLPDALQLFSPLGPTGSASEKYEGSVHTHDLLRASTTIANTLQQTGYMPATVQVATLQLSPADFIATAAALLLIIIESGNMPEQVKIQDGNFTLDREVTGENAWRWSIFPPGFDAPNLITLGKLQAWTLKPALLQ